VLPLTVDLVPRSLFENWWCILHPKTCTYTH